MKRFISVILFFGFFGFTPSVFATDACQSILNDLSTPKTINGIAYSDVISWKANYGDFHITIFYNYDYDTTQHHALKVNSYGQLGHWGEGWYRYSSWNTGICYESSGISTNHFIASWGYFYSSYPPLSTPDIHSTQPVYDINDSGVDFEPDLGDLGPQLIIETDPLDGGNVTVDETACESCPCQYPISEVYQSDLEAIANEGHAFGYWQTLENPHSLSLDPFGASGNKTITAKFFKTFRNAVIREFKQSSGYFGECLEYIEYETDLPDDVCTYSAVNCLGQATMKGYATGSTPRVGAIVIYKQGDGAMNNGHAGIVASINQGEGTMIIHDSNWNEDGIVQEHTVSMDDSDIMGYIYPTP